jgi:hypothetical protein
MEDYCFNETLIGERGLKVVRRKVIRGRKVDRYDEATNTAYQFHGCREYFPNRDDVGLPLCKRDNAISTS